MEAELIEELDDDDVNIVLLRADAGRFEVRVDAMLIFSKKDQDPPRFPDDGEILNLIRGM